MCVGVAREKIGISYIDQGSHHDTSTQEFNSNCYFLCFNVLMQCFISSTFVAERVAIKVVSCSFLLTHSLNFCFPLILSTI